MKKLVVLILFLSASTQAMAADLCTTLNHKMLNINGNGWSNGLTERISLQGPQNGTYSFQTTIQFPGQPKDQVIGTCKDRHIVFTRTRPGSFVQQYDGWIFEKEPTGMAGVFNHRVLPYFGQDTIDSSPKQYGWSGAHYFEIH